VPDAPGRFDPTRSFVDQLQELVRSEFNPFVSPFRRPVMTGDDPRSMQAPEVTVDECVSRL